MAANKTKTDYTVTITPIYGDYVWIVTDRSGRKVASGEYPLYRDGAEKEAAQAIARLRRNAKARDRRAAMNDAMASVGMRRVRGNLGGTYYE